MKNIKIFFAIFIILASSRFIPHPPNFTSLLALSFYIPVILGVSYLPMLLISFILTDIFIGFHATSLFTWGSIIIIGFTSTFFKNKLFYRLVGAQTGCLIFFILTNFGVWALGGYDYTFLGFIECYTAAIPFYINSVTGCFIFSFIIEMMIKVYKYKDKI